MSKFKPHIALLVCNILWAMDYPFYNVVLPEYVHPMAMVSGSLIATALLSLIPLAWEKSEKVARTDIRRLIGAALLIGVLRKAFIMYGLSMTSPIDGSIIDTIVPLLVLIVSVLLGMDRFTKLKVAGLALGMAGAVAVVLTGISAAHTHSHLWGNILILLCACVTSLYMVWFKRLIAKYRITTVLRWLYCTAAIIALPFGLRAIIHTDYAAIAQHALFPTLFVLIVPTYLPNLMLNYALKTVQPTVSSIYTYLQPVLAIAMSVAMGLDKLHLDLHGRGTGAAFLRHASRRARLADALRGPAAPPFYREPIQRKTIPTRINARSIALARRLRSRKSSAPNPNETTTEPRRIIETTEIIASESLNA